VSFFISAENSSFMELCHSGNFKAVVKLVGSMRGSAVTAKRACLSEAIK
jgi:hypothetical protein